MLTIGPWAVLVIYDIVLYVFRTVIYEFPIVGGRARGNQRPRAPSLAERNPRRYSLAASTGLETEQVRKKSQDNPQQSPERRAN